MKIPWSQKHQPVKPHGNHHGPFPFAHVVAVLSNDLDTTIDVVLNVHFGQFPRIYWCPLHIPGLVAKELRATLTLLREIHVNNSRPDHAGINMDRGLALKIVGGQ